MYTFVARRLANLRWFLRVQTLLNCVERRAASLQRLSFLYSVSYRYWHLLSHTIVLQGGTDNFRSKWAKCQQ